MKIKKFSILNYKAIQGLHTWTPDGSSFFLLGGNGTGKTSAGAAIIDMLTKNIPHVPITSGEHNGFLEFTFTNGASFKARFVEGKKPQLEFITPEGYNCGAPKELLQQLAGEGMGFKVDDLLRMQPLPLRKKLEAIAGIDLSEITEREKEAEEKRKLANAQHRDQLGRVQDYDKALVTKTPVVAADIASKLELLLNEQSKRVSTQTKIQNLQDTNAQLVLTITRSLQDVIDLELRMREELTTAEAKDETDLEAFIQEQARQLEAYKAKQGNAKRDRIANFNSTMENAITKRDERNAELRAKIDEAEKVITAGKAELDGPAPDAAEIEQLRTELQQAEQTNAAIAEAKRLHGEFMLAEELEKKARELNELVQAIRDEKDEKIKSSPLPAQGLTFSIDGDLLIDNLPFEDNQISAARKIRAGIEIAYSLLGDIKYLHIDGAALDKNSADLVLAFAEEKGLQLCIERPEWEGGDLKFEIADHTAAPSAEPEETPA